MTRTRGIALLVGLGIVLLIIGISAASSPDEPAPSAATTTAPEPEEEPLSTLPTPEGTQTLVFERALSECGSYDVARLAGKYNVAVKSEENVALAVGRAWARYFKAGEDAVADGRDGCLQGFSRQ